MIVELLDPIRADGALVRAVQLVHPVLQEPITPGELDQLAERIGSPRGAATVAIFHHTRLPLDVLDQVSQRDADRLMSAIGVLSTNASGVSL